MSDRTSGSTIAVLGFGNQGEAQARLLRASGATLVVGARPDGAAAARATAAGFEVLSLAAAARRAAIVAVLLPDEVLPTLWPELRPALREDGGVVFAHGFNLLYSELSFPPHGDVVLVSPAGPGTALRRSGEGGARLPAYLAVHQDGTGKAWELAESWASHLGLGPLHRTTVRAETEVDLFGEQTVLCGGMNALVRAAFETLVAAGYEPEMAYLECVHQLAALAELLRDRGIAGFRRAISGTALYGDLTRGPRVIDEPSRVAMGAILAEIRSGAFAAEWRDEVRRGRPRLEAAWAEGANDPLEQARRKALGESG